MQDTTDVRVAARDAAATDPAAARAGQPFPGDARPRAATLTSVAMALPATVVGNDVVAERCGVTEDWIVTRTGVRERRIAADGERVADLAAAAGRLALERAGVRADEIDLLLVATLAADELTPGVAPLVAQELGAQRAGAMDVGAACTGFLAGLSLAVSQVESGRASHVLLIGAEKLSRLTDTSDRRTAGLFADGAGAAVIGAATGSGGIGPIALHSDGTGASYIYATHEEGLLRMKGHETFREAVRRISEVTIEAAELAGVALEDIDLFVYHQANARILSAVADRLGLDSARVLDCIDRYGNTSSATLPIALAEADAAGRLQPGATVLLGAFGAGFTWGAGVIEWE